MSIKHRKFVVGELLYIISIGQLCAFLFHSHTWFYDFCGTKIKQTKENTAHLHAHTPACSDHRVRLSGRDAGPRPVCES